METTLRLSADLVLYDDDLSTTQRFAPTVELSDLLAGGQQGDDWAPPLSLGHDVLPLLES